jgi:hypothetical protein
MLEIFNTKGELNPDFLVWEAANAFYGYFDPAIYDPNPEVFINKSELMLFLNSYTGKIFNPNRGIGIEALCLEAGLLKKVDPKKGLYYVRDL